MLRRFVAVSFGVLLSLRSLAAQADPAAAEASFREGRALLERGELGPACEAFEVSQKLEPSSGTLLNLAVCRAKQGKTATAWAHFVAAERLARNQNRADQAEEAKQRKLELESRLSTLTLSVAAAPPGLEVRRDGVVVEPASYSARVPVDPGKVVISASAPGYESLSFEVTLSESVEQRVVVPSLKKLPESSESPSTKPRTESRVAAQESESNPWPWVVGGIGGAALLTGGVFGVMALSSNSTAKEQCEQRTSDCPDEAVETAERRDREATASTIGIGVGLVGLGAATIWALSSPGKREQSAWSYGGELTRDTAFLRVRAGF